MVFGYKSTFDGTASNGWSCLESGPSRFLGLGGNVDVSVACDLPLGVKCWDFGTQNKGGTIGTASIHDRPGAAPAVAEAEGRGRTGADAAGVAVVDFVLNAPGDEKKGEPHQSHCTISASEESIRKRGLGVNLLTHCKAMEAFCRELSPNFGDGRAGQAAAVTGCLSDVRLHDLRQRSKGHINNAPHSYFDVALCLPGGHFSEIHPKYGATLLC
jgi:hypothetical protein